MRIFSLGTYNLIVGVVQVRNEDLIDLLFAVSADLTDIAHQLRCPLMGVMGCCWRVWSLTM